MSSQVYECKWLSHVGCSYTVRLLSLFNFKLFNFLTVYACEKFRAIAIFGFKFQAFKKLVIELGTYILESGEEYFPKISHVT